MRLHTIRHSFFLVAGLLCALAISGPSLDDHHNGSKPSHPLTFSSSVPIPPAVPFREAIPLPTLHPTSVSGKSAPTPLPTRRPSRRHRHPHHTRHFSRNRTRTKAPKQRPTPTTQLPIPTLAHSPTQPFLGPNDHDPFPTSPGQSSNSTIPTPSAPGTFPSSTNPVVASIPSTTPPSWLPAALSSGRPTGPPPVSAIPKPTHPKSPVPIYTSRPLSSSSTDKVEVSGGELVFVALGATVIGGIGGGFFSIIGSAGAVIPVAAGTNVAALPDAVGTVSEGVEQSLEPEDEEETKEEEKDEEEEDDDDDDDDDDDEEDEEEELPLESSTTYSHHSSHARRHTHTRHHTHTRRHSHTSRHSHTARHTHSAMPTPTKNRVWPFDNLPTDTPSFPAGAYPRIIWGHDFMPRQQRDVFIKVVQSVIPLDTLCSIVDETHFIYALTWVTDEQKKRLLDSSHVISSVDIDRSLRDVRIYGASLGYQMPVPGGNAGGSNTPPQTSDLPEPTTPTSPGLPTRSHDGVVERRLSMVPRDVTHLGQRRDHNINSAVTKQKDAPLDLVMVSTPPGVDPLGQESYDFKSKAGSGITVYNVDTGMFMEAKGYTTSKQPRWLFTRVGDTKTDRDEDTGHGTCTASRINHPIYGTAKNVDLVIVKIGRLTSDLLAALRVILKDVKENNLSGKAVISLPVDSSAPPPKVMEILEYYTNQLLQADVVIVASGGNRRAYMDPDSKIIEREVIGYPSALAAKGLPIINVGSVDLNGRNASFAIKGSLIHVMAPGVSVGCASHNAQLESSLVRGSDFATPTVAGLAAYFLSLHQHNQLYTPGKVAENMRRLLMTLAYPRIEGAGRVVYNDVASSCGVNNYKRSAKNPLRLNNGACGQVAEEEPIPTPTITRPALEIDEPPIPTPTIPLPALETDEPPIPEYTFQTSPQHPHKRPHPMKLPNPVPLPPPPKTPQHQFRVSFILE